MLNKTQKELIGLGRVQQIVCVDWASGWQEYDHRNDDGIDGVIIMSKGQKKPYKTGGLVFAQVKCGGDGYRQDQAQYPNHIGVALGPDYIEKHRPRWDRVPGPAVLIFVDDTIDRYSPPAWWIDLKSDDSYSKTNKGMILIPATQRFSAGTKGHFHKLCGSGPIDRELQVIRMEPHNSLKVHLGKDESLRKDAWEFYKLWRADTDACNNPTLGHVHVNRVGWKHLTRRGRANERIIQSWLLLAAAKEIIKNVSAVDLLGRAKVNEYEDNTKVIEDFLGLRAVVTFPYRHHSVVQVVLKRSRVICSNPRWERTKIWFFSVYERRRGMGLV